MTFIHSLTCRALACAFVASTAGAQSLMRISVTSTGQQATTPDPLGVQSREAVVTRDGNFVVFTSNASNLSPTSCATVSGYEDHVYRANVITGEVLLVDEGTSAAAGSPSVSDDGNLVAYISNGEVYVADLSSGTCPHPVNRVLTGYTLSGTCSNPMISGNGQYVAFESTSGYFSPTLPSGVTWLPTVITIGGTPYMETNTLGSEGTFLRKDIFRVDVSYSGAYPNPTVRWVSYSLNTPGSVATPNNCSSPTISMDGRYVAFMAFPGVLLPNENLAFSHSYVWDATAAASQALTGVGYLGLAEANSDVVNPSISPDGRYVAFESQASNLVVGDAFNCGGSGPLDPDAFYKDVQTGNIVRITTSYQGTELCLGSAFVPSVSSGARRVALSSDVGGLTADSVINGRTEVYSRDPSIPASITRVSVKNPNPNPDMALHPSEITYHEVLGPDDTVVFSSTRTDLVPNDTNGTGTASWAGRDVFLWSSYAPPDVGTKYCFGDNTSTTCPCGNASPVGSESGCLNSLGTGAALSASGYARITADTLVLTGTGMPNATALYFQGTAPVHDGSAQNPFGVKFGDGLRCVGGAITRLGTKQNASGASRYPDTGDQSISVKALLPAAGGTFYYQVWYRNAASFCTSATFNLSNGMKLVWLP